MDTDNAISLAEIADTLDNLIHAMKLPMPPEQHMKHLATSLTHCRDVLRRVYAKEEDYNPWEDVSSNVQSKWRAACGTSKRLQGAV